MIKSVLTKLNLLKRKEGDKNGKLFRNAARWRIHRRYDKKIQQGLLEGSHQKGENQNRDYQTRREKTQWPQAKQKRIFQAIMA